MNNEEQQELLHYYVARVDDKQIIGIPSSHFPWSVAKKWEVAFLINVDLVNGTGTYDHEDGNRYYVDVISKEEYDMLIAFGVECVTEFPAEYPL